MSVLNWIILGGLLMSSIALIGSITIFLKEETLNKLLLPLVALAAGSLLGGAFFHMLPVAVSLHSTTKHLFLYVIIGFTLFLALEQFMHWHHCHRNYVSHKEPATYLILIADALHNLIGGIVVGGAFIFDISLGLTTWLISAAHEIPQELGDFAVLVHGGWSKKTALLYNLISGLTFLLGGLIVYSFSNQMNVSYLLAFAAGNFIYIGASDLIPQVNKSRNIKEGLVTFLMFLLGILLLYLLS